MSFPFNPGLGAMIALATLAAPLPAADDHAGSSTLRMWPAASGSTGGIDLRTAATTTPFVLFLGPSIQPLDADGVGPMPFVRVLGAGTVIVPAVTDASGRFAASTTVPNLPALHGALLFAQALTVVADGGVEATNVAATTITPATATPAFADASAQVPLAGKVHSSGPGAAQDLDGDGDPDLVLVTGSGGTVHVFRNDGALAFTDVTASAIPPEAQIKAAGVELFDADGDRRIDILVLGGSGDASNPPLPNLLLLNQGGLVFTVANLPRVAGLPRDVAVADLDHDGDLDLVFANGHDGVHATEQPVPNTLLVNQGHAQFGAEGTFVVDGAFQAAAWNSPEFNACVVAGDIDNDGDLDLFFGRIDSQAIDGVPGQPNVLLRNDGGLSFTDVSLTHLNPLYSDNTQGAAFGDLDGDGWLDLMVANSTVSIPSANSGAYYRNQGNGVFIDDKIAFPQIDESEIALRNGLRLVDVDLDGDLDVLVFLHEFLDFDSSSGASTGGEDQLFLNQGGLQGGVHGTFVLAPAPLFGVGGVFTTSDHVVADFDLDGDDDIYVSNAGGFFSAFPLDDRLIENKRIP